MTDNTMEQIVAIRTTLASLLNNMREGYVKEKSIRRDIEDALAGIGCSEFDGADSTCINTVEQQLENFSVTRKTDGWFYIQDGIEVGPFSTFRETVQVLSDINSWY